MVDVRDLFWKNTRSVTLHSLESVEFVVMADVRDLFWKNKSTAKLGSGKSCLSPL